MKSISAELLAEQQKAAYLPYIYLKFTSKDAGTTFDYSSDQEGRRILYIDHREEAYDDHCTIILRDNDRTIPDLKGYWTEIGYGAITGETVAYPDGNSDTAEYALTSRLWVKNQHLVSAGGKLFTVLELGGMWSVLREMIMRLGNIEEFYVKDYTTDTPYDIIGYVLAERGFTLAALGAEDDGIIDTFIPQFSINQVPFEDGATVIYRLIMLTKSYLRAKTGLEFEVIYPEDSDAAVITYYNNQVPYFYEYIEKTNILVPNHIYVIANRGEDGEWTNILYGEASDSSAIAKYFETYDVKLAPSVTTQADATTRAEVILARAKTDILSGRGIHPHDCRVELHDKIAIEDTRGT